MCFSATYFIISKNSSTSKILYLSTFFDAIPPIFCEITFCLIFRCSKVQPFRHAFRPPNSESGGTFCPHSRYVAKIQFKFTIHTNLEVIYFSSSLRPSSLHITYYPSYLILSTSVSFFRLLLKTQESTICNRPTKKIIIKIGTIGT